MIFRRTLRLRKYIHQSRWDWLNLLDLPHTDVEGSNTLETLAISRKLRAALFAFHTEESKALYKTALTAGRSVRGSCHIGRKSQARRDETCSGRDPHDDHIPERTVQHRRANLGV